MSLHNASLDEILVPFDLHRPLASSCASTVAPDPEMNRSEFTGAVASAHGRDEKDSKGHYESQAIIDTPCTLCYLFFAMQKILKEMNKCILVINVRWRCG